MKNCLQKTYLNNCMSQQYNLEFNTPMLSFALETVDT